MSNYSTFFPSGTASGGGSAPMNSYAAIRVAGTGNPTGYDATTGLYIQESGESWLKSGTTLNTQVYPLALGGGTRVHSKILPFIARPTTQYNGFQDIVYVKSSGKYWMKTQTTLYEMTVSGATSSLTGNSFTVASLESFTYDETNDTFWMNVNGATPRFAEYAVTSSYAATGRSMSKSGISADYITWDAKAGTIWGKNARVITEYNISTAAATGRTITAPAELPGIFLHITATDTIWCFSNANYNNETRNAREFTVGTASAAGVATGNIILQSQIWQNASLVGVTETDVGLAIGFFSKGISEFNWTTIVGDSTARTDSSGSGQPLFLRIG